MRYIIFNSDNEHYFFTNEDVVMQSAKTDGHEIIDLEAKRVLQCAAGEHDLVEYTLEGTEPDEDSDDIPGTGEDPDHAYESKEDK